MMTTNGTFKISKKVFAKRKSLKNSQKYKSETPVPVDTKPDKSETASNDLESGVKTMRSRKSSRDKNCKQSHIVWF